MLKTGTRFVFRSYRGDIHSGWITTSGRNSGIRLCESRCYTPRVAEFNTESHSGKHLPEAKKFRVALP